MVAAPSSQDICSNCAALPASQQIIVPTPETLGPPRLHWQAPVGSTAFRWTHASWDNAEVVISRGDRIGR